VAKRRSGLEEMALQITSTQITSDNLHQSKKTHKLIDAMHRERAQIQSEKRLFTVP